MTTEALDSSIVSKLKFINRTLWFIDNNCVKTLHEIDNASVKKIVALLKGGSLSLQSTDKVFILPDSESRLDDLKQYIKQAGAKVTGKIEKATVLLGNENINKEEYYGMSSKYICIPNGYNIHVNNDIDDAKSIFHRVTDDWNALKLSDISIVDNTALAYSERDCDNYSRAYYSYNYRVPEDTTSYLTTFAVSIIYLVLSKKIRVLSESALLEAQSKTNVINENSYHVLDGMLKGSTEDKLTAQTIIYNCNVNKSFYWLKKLIEDNTYAIANNRKKAFKTFLRKLDVSYLSDIAYMTTWDFIKECIKRDVFYDNVRSGLVDQLDKEIRADITSRTAREYNECVEIEYKIDYDKLIEHVKS